MPIPAFYFDGRSSRRHAVELDVRDRRVIITGDEIDRSEHVDAMQFGAELGNTPRLIRFPDGASCEVGDHAALKQLLAAAGVAGDRVAELTNAKKWVLVSAALLIVVLVVGYRFGVPIAAIVISERLPVQALNTIGDQSLATLDHTAFTPSAVPADRQRALAAEFLRLRSPRAGSQPVHLLFRKSDAIGANALALPSGDIVVTDGMLSLIHDDRELMGVLLHERSHVLHRHGVRLLLENSIVQLFLAWYVGDINTLAVTAPTALVQARYSRELEQQADDDAAVVMRLNGIPTAQFANLLERLESTQGRRQMSVPYLSSHPATAERIQRLRKP